MATGFDLFGLFLLVVMSVGGLKKGLIDGVLKIVGIYAASYAAMNYHQYGSALLEPIYSLPAAYQAPAGFVIIFLITMYSINLLAFILKKIVKTMRLGVVDKIGGITFGVLKAGLILSALVWVSTMVPADMQGNWKEESKLYPFADVFAGQMVSLLSLEDELAMLETMMDPDADKTALLQTALGGDDTEGLSGLSGIMGGADDMEGFTSDDSSQASAVQKAMDNMGGARKGIMQQVLKSAGIEGLGGDDGLDIMKEVDKIKNADGNREAKMEQLMKELEAEAQGLKEE